MVYPMWVCFTTPICGGFGGFTIAIDALMSSLGAWFQKKILHIKASTSGKTLEDLNTWVQGDLPWGDYFWETIDLVYSGYFGCFASVY